MRGRTGAVASVSVLVLAVAALVYGLRRGPGPDPEPPAPRRDAGVYAGLGAWVDVFDYAPSYQRDGSPPVVAPADMALLAARGVRTLYLQAARHDAPGIVDPAVAGELLAEARSAGVSVVGWYLPTFADVGADLERLRLIRRFEHDGHRFDGVAVDIEYRDAVTDPAERGRRLVELSRRLRHEVGDDAVGAIVPPPVLLEVVNPDNWPGFPWVELADLYDVWLPMAYWTFRTEASGWRDGRRYTEESVARLRANLGRADAPVHPIGGIADEAGEAAVAGFVEAAEASGAVGLSLYDFRTTTHGGWAQLRAAALALGAEEAPPAADGRG